MEEYDIMIYKNDEVEHIGYAQVKEDGTGSFYLFWTCEEKISQLTDNKWFHEYHSGNIDVLTKMITEENRQKDRRRAVYYCDEFIIRRQAKRTGESYLVYNRMAKEGEPGYSKKSHAVPHLEPGAKDMDEWVNHYQFNKLDDGTYEAELDEAWWWGGSHTDGGTLYRDIYDTWQDLPYDEFLENVITVAAAKHYLFTVEDLKACEGLKEFFGY